MTTPDELQRAVKRLTKAAKEPAAWSNYHSEARTDDLRLLLSERAEFLAAVKRMRGALMAAQSFIADGGLAETDPGASIYRQITAALTTGEANHKDKT